MTLSPAWHSHPFTDHRHPHMETHCHGDVYEPGHDHPDLGLGPVESD